MTVLSGFIGTIIGYTIGSALAAFAFRLYEYVQIRKARDKYAPRSIVEVTQHEVVETHAETD